MSETNKEQNNNNNNENDNNDNDDTKKEEDQEGVDEQKLEQEIQETMKRLQYLYARKWDLACKREREMQQQKGESTESPQDQEQKPPQYGQFYGPWHNHGHHHGHHHGFHPWWQWKQQCGQSPEENFQGQQGPRERCFQPPPFCNPWWQIGFPGCRGHCGPKCHKCGPCGQNKGGKQRGNPHCHYSPEDWYSYWYGCNVPQQQQPPPQETNKETENNNNNNDNDN